MVASGGTDTTPAAGGISEGKPAPDFTAKAHDGLSIQPSAMKGKYVVLYFYPKDETPGCTRRPARSVMRGRTSRRPA